MEELREIHLRGRAPGGGGPARLGRAFRAHRNRRGGGAVTEGVVARAAEEAAQGIAPRPVAGIAGRPGHLRLLLRLLVLLVAACVAASGPLAAQRVERMEYRNPRDGTPLTATLHLPAGEGPFPAVVVLTLAGVDALAERLGAAGWAVMVPERRGMGGAPELELAVGFEEMAGDGSAALERLRARRDVQEGAVGLLAQGGETMVGTVAADSGTPPSFLVLVSPRGVGGDELFRLQQRRSARDRRLEPGEVEALDGLVEEINTIARSPGSASLRAYRIRSLLGAASVRPQQSSSLPPDLEGQVRFLASPWWHDFATFSPASALARLRVPTLAVEGDPPYLPADRSLAAVRSGLDGAPSPDVTVCVVEGRVEHAFPGALLDAVEAWLSARRPPGAGGAFRARPETPRPRACRGPAAGEDTWDGGDRPASRRSQAS